MTTNFPIRKLWRNGWEGDFFLCLLTASLLWIGPSIASWRDGWRMKVSPLYLMPDSSIYLGIIERAAQTKLDGDPFLWEHRHDPGSLLSFYNFWPKIYGCLSRHIGLPFLLYTSFLLSAMWFFALLRLCRILGQPRAYAYFTAGMITFFSVNIAYNAIGYRTHFELWNLWLTEHLRLYPTLTSMTIYSLAVWLTFKSLTKSFWLLEILGGIMIGLTAYGRPHDWAVMMLFLIILGIVLSLRCDWKRLLHMSIFLCTALIVSAWFLWNFQNYQSTHAVAYLDQVARGNLAVKFLSHYIKYGIITFITWAVLSWWLGAWQSFKKNARLDDAHLFLLCLLAASLLAHFHTLSHRITMAGISYFFVFSIAPWVTLCILHGTYLRFGRTYFTLFNSNLFGLALLGLLLTQQIGLGFHALTITKRWKLSDDQLKVYTWLQKNASPEDVVLGIVGSGEMSVLTGGVYSFLPHPVVATYISSAPTTELLDRFLATKFILTGTISDLQLLFSDEGIPDAEKWEKNASLEMQGWFNLLTHSIGRNFFILHPQKNAGDLAVRGIKLPASLQNQTHFVIYFNASMRAVFQKWMREETKAITPNEIKLDVIFRELKTRYRLNYLIVNPITQNAKERFTKSSFLQLVMNTPTCQLWHVTSNSTSF